MSITFSRSRKMGQEFTDDGLDVNMSNVNAFDVMRHLGIESDYCGTIKASELVVKCRRRLMAVVGAPLDPERVAVVDLAPGRATFIECGRREGYLRDRTDALLRLAESAVPGEDIHWS